MKHPDRIEQKHLKARAFPFFKFCTQFTQQCFNVGPTDVGRYRPGKDQFQCSLMLAFHCEMIPETGIVEPELAAKRKPTSVGQPDSCRFSLAQLQGYFQ
ncbi:MAG: hypothetical protein PHS22_11950 [Rhodoferax sp.]|nr:hypothetical protein [Rhodoferax sp.]